MNPNPMNPQQPASQAKKMSTAAIVLIVMGVLFIPCIGCLAAIAIPNFIRFQARSKQSEAKMNLKSVFIAEKSFKGEKDLYSEDAKEIGFSPEKGTRYLYITGPGQEIAPSNRELKLSVEQLRAGLPSDLEPGVAGDCPDCEVTVVALGNIDNDDTVDVWSVSTEERTIQGQMVPPGQPFNHVNDVTD